MDSIGMILGAVLQIVALLVVLFVGMVAVVVVGGMAYACGVLVIERIRARRKGD